MKISNKVKKKKKNLGLNPSRKRWRFKKKNQSQLLLGSALCRAAHGCPSTKSIQLCIQTDTDISPAVLPLGLNPVGFLCFPFRQQVSWIDPYLLFFKRSLSPLFSSPFLGPSILVSLAHLSPAHTHRCHLCAFLLLLLFFFWCCWVVVDRKLSGAWLPPSDMESGLELNPVLPKNARDLPFTHLSAPFPVRSLF